VTGGLLWWLGHIHLRDTILFNIIFGAFVRRSRPLFTCAQSFQYSF
jgi:hypothetical protein